MIIDPDDFDSLPTKTQEALRQKFAEAGERVRRYEAALLAMLGAKPDRDGFTPKEIQIAREFVSTVEGYSYEMHKESIAEARAEIEKAKTESLALRATLANPHGTPIAGRRPQA